MTSVRCGGCGARSNSRISAPAQKLLPAHASTIARTVLSAIAPSSAATSPTRTSFDSALTGGWSIVISATAPSRESDTTGALADNVEAPDQPKRTYSRSSGLALMPVAGIAIQLANSSERKPYYRAAAGAGRQVLFQRGAVAPMAGRGARRP